MSSHVPGAMRVAAAIVNARSSIATADGDKTAGELADFIETETRILELIDASEDLLRSVEPGDSVNSVPRARLEQLRTALLEVVEGGADDEASHTGDRRH